MIRPSIVVHAALGALFLLSACRSSPPPSSGASPELCDQLVKEASEGRPLPAHLKDAPWIGGLREFLRDVYECRMVQTDTLETCRQVAPDVYENCRAKYIFYHRARSKPADVTWHAILADGIRADCMAIAAQLPKGTCDQFYESIANRNASLCPNVDPKLRQGCECLVTAEPAKCPDKDSRNLSHRMTVLYDGGLERLTRDGGPNDRVMSAAALGRPDACKPMIDQLRNACSPVSSPAPGSQPGRPDAN
jgi:hypothetical protein